MEFLHASSTSATIAELDLFKVPPTQTVIESMYDVEYRPIGSLTKASVFEFVTPPSEHYTDLSATHLHIKFKLNVDPATAKITPTNNFAASLFEQLDVYLGTTNITPGNSLFHYQTYIDDLFFKHRSPIDDCQMVNSKEDERIKRIKKDSVDLVLSIHAPMFQQEKFLVDGVPITMRLKSSLASFGIKSDDAKSVSIDFQHLSLFIRRIKLFPNVQMALTNTIQKSPATYYFQRNEVKSFHLPTGFAANSLDNVYNGQLPRKVIVGFIPDKAFNGDIKTDCFSFTHQMLNQISFIVNGISIPSSPYKPDFEQKLYMREFFNAFRSMNQETGISSINLNYSDFESKLALFVFDFTDDGTLAMDSGALSLVKRGSARVEINFKKALAEGVHMIAFGIYDSVLQIDASRNVMIDY